MEDVLWHYISKYNSLLISKKELIMGIQIDNGNKFINSDVTRRLKEKL